MLSDLKINREAIIMSMKGCYKNPKKPNLATSLLSSAHGTWKHSKQQKEASGIPFIPHFYIRSE